MGLSTNGKPITPFENSWAYKQALNRGASAAARGQHYNSNPYRSAAERLAWSEGHNGMRAKIQSERRL